MDPWGLSRAHEDWPIATSEYQDLVPFDTIMFNYLLTNTVQFRGFYESFLAYVTVRRDNELLARRFEGSVGAGCAAHQ
jgi:hypothetical protein